MSQVFQTCLVNAPQFSSFSELEKNKTKQNKQHFCNLLQDIQDLLVTWAEHLKEASAIFVRAPSYNKTIFFSGRAAPLDKKDPRIRTLPFATRRATFREVQRVHEMLSTIHVYGERNNTLELITYSLLIQPRCNQKCLHAGKDTDMSAVFSPSKKAWKKTVKPVLSKSNDQVQGKFKWTL